MSRTRSAIVAAAVCTLLPLVGGCASGTGARYAVVDGERIEVPRIAMGDARTIERIVDEGWDNSQVFDHLTYLCTEFGPRLTGSTASEDAGRWARDQFEAWGLENARMSQWGEVAVRFDRGPSSAKAIFAGTERELSFSTLAWVRGTDGPVRGRALAMPESYDEYDANAGSYAGAWVMFKPDYGGRAGIRSTGFLMRQRHSQFQKIRAGEDIQPERPRRAADGQEWSGTLTYNGSPIGMVLNLTREGRAFTGGTMEIVGFHSGPISDVSFDRADRTLSYTWKHSMGASNVELTIDGDAATGESVSGDTVSPIALQRTVEPDTDGTPDPGEDRPSLLALVLAENPAGFVSSSKDRRVWTTSKSGWRDTPLGDYGQDVEINVSGPDYDFIAARMAGGNDVELEFDLAHELVDGPIPVYNTIAEIRGTELPDEVVIMSAHLDSWDGPGSQGTIDNGTGTSVTLEAARILAAAGVQPKRTIRFILWTGEEQGLLGSRAYVESLGDEERAKISAVFVDDGGTNYQGGLQATPFMADMLAAATAPTNGRFVSLRDQVNQLHDDLKTNDADAGMMNVNVRIVGNELPRGGGSDHASFNAIGIPGFFWDETGRANYRHGWHTQFDRLDQAIPEYLAQSATNTAITLYNLANAPTLLPREAAGE